MALARSSSAQTKWIALIRTHHITSRKKVAKLKQAATTCNVFVLLRSGGCPGIMYVEGPSAGVESWVEAVQKLRYKDFQLVARPASSEGSTSGSGRAGIVEIATVKDFGVEMENFGVLGWWRRAMGYSHDDAKM